MSPPCLLVVWLVTLFLFGVNNGLAQRPSHANAVVELEEEVYAFEPAQNGAGPMWCFGNSCVVRQNDRVYVSSLHTIPELEPLNNCRTVLLQRDSNGWAERYEAKDRTREPSPLGVFHDGRVFVSLNPTLTPANQYSGPSQPSIAEFATATGKLRRLQPRWSGTPGFSEHSYRTFAVDGERGEFILLQNIGYTHAEWSYFDRDGNWSACGQLYWPRDPTTGKPIRVCYPSVALDNKRVYFLGVSDIVEPNREWLDYKREVTGREWDYVFRRLYYTWSDDITSHKFHPWVEIENLDTTAGSLFVNDLIVHENGETSVLWSSSKIDTRLREKFFPEAKQRQTLEYARLDRGKLLQRQSLVENQEGQRGLVPGRGRFHRTPDNQIWIAHYVSGFEAASGTESGQVVSQNRLTQLENDGGFGAPIALGLQQPLTSFFTNTTRAGCQPSWTLDLLGQSGNTMRYARIRIELNP